MGESIDGGKIRNVKLKISLIEQSLIDWDIRVITDSSLNGGGRGKRVSDGLFNEVNKKRFLVFVKVTDKKLTERFFGVPIGVDNIFGA